MPDSDGDGDWTAPDQESLHKITTAVASDLAKGVDRNAIAQGLVTNDGWPEEAAIGFVDQVEHERREHQSEEQPSLATTVQDEGAREDALVATAEPREPAVDWKPPLLAYRKLVAIWVAFLALGLGVTSVGGELGSWVIVAGGIGFFLAGAVPLCLMWGLSLKRFRGAKLPGDWPAFVATGVPNLFLMLGGFVYAVIGGHYLIYGVSFVGVWTFVPALFTPFVAGFVNTRTDA